jgi:tRNA (guanine26-N2/guanine27-N2)-dimethyltransferase
MVSEGEARIKVFHGVFYNPKMKFCRDFDMEVFKVIKEKERRVNYLDALSGTGIRGIRAFLEAGFQPFFNDFSKRAVECIKENLKLNGITAEVFNTDATVLMRERKFFHIDIDPFGSPAEFIDSAVKFPKYLSVTATDTSALCGSATVSGLRKYGAYAVKTEYYPEVGIRVLIGRILSESGKYDKAPEILVSFAREHFYRVHLRFKRSPSAVKKAFKKYGYIFHCFNCLRRFVSPIGGEVISKCICGRETKMIGPLWLGELHNQEFIKWNSENEGVSKLISKIRGEPEIPLYYDLHHITKNLNLSPPPIEKIIEELRSIGYKAGRTRFSGTSIKTDADIEEMKRIIKSLKR